MRVALLSAAALSLILSLALAACSQPAEKAPAPAKVEPRALAGVDLDQPVRVLGTEPFWAVEIKPDGLTYSGVDRAEQKAANPGPSSAGHGRQLDRQDRGRDGSDRHPDGDGLLGRHERPHLSPDRQGRDRG
jgi:uncharacterized membrane protein